MASASISSRSRPRNPIALVGPLACGCALVGAAAYVAITNPSDGGAFLPCPFRLLTGWWCPGCGLTRATHHLLRGDIIEALRFNVFVMIVLVALGGAWLRWTLATARWQSRRLPPLTRRGTQIACVTLTVYALARNIPAFAWMRG